MKKLFCSIVSTCVSLLIPLSSLSAQGQASFLQWIPVTHGSNFRALGNIGDAFYFLMDGPLAARELWRTNGTNVGTIKVKEVASSALAYDGRTSYPQLCSEGVNTTSGLIFGISKDPTDSARCELWKTDGTSVGTAKLLDVDGVSLLAAAGQGVVFVPYGATGWDRLMSYDGLTTTVLQSNVQFYSSASFGGRALFIGSTGLWSTDGTLPGTQRIKDLGSISYFSVSSLVNYGSGVGFIVHRSPPNGVSEKDYFEFYTSDGTSAGTKIQYTFTRPALAKGEETRTPYACRAGNSLALTIPELASDLSSKLSVYSFSEGSGVKLLKSFAASTDVNPPTQYLYPTMTTENYCFVDSYENSTFRISSSTVDSVPGIYPLWGGNSKFPRYVTVGDSIYTPQRYDAGWQINVAQPTSIITDAFLSIPAPFTPVGQGLAGNVFVSFEQNGDTLQVRGIDADLCPLNSLKVAPGQCGCGTLDLDPDHDYYPTCIDLCPNDPQKIAPAQCGCGMPDTDTDGDGKADCVDTCPLDGRKSAPGQCGCGNPDVDIDGDGVAACLDQCSNDNKKTSPGICGCGVADTDSDGDGIVDCLDGCSADSKKASPGLCGCGVSDVDSDGDGVPDCKDLCVADATKQSPGKCGCGISDVDSDGDGVPNCQDLCPSDARKTSPGSLGCGRVESSTSVVVTPVVSAEPQKIQTCAAGSIKSEPGACGCSVLDTDVNKNGVIDCKEPSKLALPVAAVVSVKMRTLKVTLPTFNGVTFELTFTKGAKRRVVVSQTALLTFKNFERGAWVLRYRMLLAGGVDRTPPSARARFEVK